MLKSKCYFSREYLFFPVFFLFCSITYNTNLHFCGLCMLCSIKCTSENTKYKRIYISRRVAVSSLTNIKYLQQEIFKKQRLRSVSVFLSPPQRQFAFTLKKFALDFKYEQRSRRPRSPSVSLRCLYLQSSAIINL